MWESLIGAVAGAGIAALTGRPGWEIATAAAGGAAMGAFTAVVTGDGGRRGECLTDVLESLVVKGEAENVDITPGGDKVTFTAPDTKAARRATATLLQCNPERAYYNPYTNKVTAEF